MKFAPVLLGARREQMITGEYWFDRTILDFFYEAVTRSPGKVALVSESLDGGSSQSFTYQELIVSVKRLSVWLSPCRF